LFVRELLLVRQGFEEPGKAEMVMFEREQEECTVLWRKRVSDPGS
jgi:hypothetical protein